MSDDMVLGDPSVMDDDEWKAEDVSEPIWDLAAAEAEIADLREVYEAQIAFTRREKARAEAAERRLAEARPILADFAADYARLFDLVAVV